MALVVEFRTGIEDKLPYALSWLRKAAAAGARTQVIGQPSDLQALDRALWTELAEDFVPHARTGAGLGPSGQLHTLIWLGSDPVTAPAPTLLLNIGASVPSILEGFERVIELVSADPEDAEAGRSRWMTYKQRGLAPVHRDARIGG